MQTKNLKNKKTFLSLICLLLCALFLAACSSGGNAPTTSSSAESVQTRDAVPSGTTSSPDETESERPSSAASEEPSTLTESASAPTPSLPAPTTGTDPSSLTTQTDLPVRPVSKTVLLSELPFPSPLTTGTGTGSASKNVINVFENRRTINGHKIQLLSTNLCLDKTALAAFEELNAALGDAYPSFQLILLACCTNESEGLRCSKSESELFSHSTGFSADCWFMTVNSRGEKVSLQFYDGAAAEKTAFLLKKAAELGVVQDRAFAAGHSNEDLRHLTYVGAPHASYIYEKRLTVEDYLARLRSYTPEEPLFYTCNSSYALYSVPLPEGSETAEIPLYEDCAYTICNCGDYAIVSVVLSDAVPTLPSTPTPSAEPTPTVHENAPTVYLDPGHGFTNSYGARDNGAGEGSVYLELARETLGKDLYEADLNLQISLKVEEMLKERGYNVIMSRKDFVNEHLSISARAARAKEAGADLLVSVHANSAANPDACGARVYYNAKDSFSKKAESLAFAEETCRQINLLCPSPVSSYPVDGQTLAMLNGTGSIPSILVETCFLTNEADARNALDDAWQTNMARAIVNAIVERFPV